MDSRVFISLALVVGLLFVAFPLSVHAEDSDSGSDVQTKIEANPREFIDLFLRQQTRAGFVTSSANRYISACCKDKDTAIKLLKDSGFKLSIASEQGRVDHLNKHWKANPPYDDFIWGRRGTSLRKFWDIFSAYEVMIFIKDGEVVRVDAQVRDNFL